MLLAFVIYWLFPMTFGTALPAAANGGRYGLALTLRRARHSFRHIGWCLLCGPGLFGVLSGGAAYLLLYATGQSSDAQHDSAVSALGILTALMAQLGGLLTTTLAVIVLCDGYRNLAHIPGLAATAP